MSIGWIHLWERAVVIQLETNHSWWIPKEKFNDAISIIKEHSNIPSNAKPKWYLEDDVDLKEPDKYLLPGKPLVSNEDMAKSLATFLSAGF